MKCNFKRLLSGLLVLMILSSFMAMSVSADVLDLNRKCSLNMKLQMPDENGELQPVDGTVGLYQVALTRYDGPDQVLDPTASFVGADIDFRNITDEDTLLKRVPVDALELHIRDYHLRPKFKAETDEEGVVRFRNLPAGLYMVSRVKPNEGPAHYTMNSFLVMLPKVNDEGNYDYACRTPMKPKVEIGKELIDIVVIKRWEKDKPENRPENITVKLMNSLGLEVESQILSKNNNWTCTFFDKPADEEWTIQERKTKGYIGKVGEMILKDGRYEVIITNTYDPDNPLAQTGQLNWPIPLLIAGGLLLCIGGYAVSHEKKKI